MFKVQIKEILPENFGDIISVIDETWEPTYRDIISQEQITFMQQEIYTPESLLNQYNAGQRFFGLYENENITGFASYSDVSAATFKLNKIYILPSAQGKGYGQLLLNFIEQEVKKAGADFLILNVNKFNPAKHFYEKVGFKFLKEEDIAIGSYFMNDYVLQKKLA